MRLQPVITLGPVEIYYHSIGNSHRLRRSFSFSRALGAHAPICCLWLSVVKFTCVQVGYLRVKNMRGPNGNLARERNRCLSGSRGLVLPVTLLTPDSRPVFLGALIHFLREKAMRPLLTLVSVPGVLAFLSGGGVRQPDCCHAYTRRQHVSTSVKASSGSYPDYVPPAVSEIEEPVSETCVAVGYLVLFC